MTAYTKNTTWVSGSSPGIDAAALNNLETQYDCALTEIKRTIWVQPHHVSGTSSTLNTTYSVNGGGNGCSLANNEDNLAYFMVAIPSTFATLVKAVVVFMTNTTGNLYISATTEYAKNGQIYNTHTGSVAVAAVPYSSATYYQEYSIASALASVAADDYVGVAFKRTATNVLDTCELALIVCGLLIEYK